ncbi:hypothetical protein THAOC_05528, partial [Thalassiosira oceanica]
PEAEAKAEQAAADLLAELGLDDLEGSSNAPKKGARSAPPAGKKKKRGGKKKGPPWTFLRQGSSIRWEDSTPFTWDLAKKISATPRERPYGVGGEHGERHMSLPPRPIPAPHDVRAEARARHAVPRRDVRERLGPDAAAHAPQGEADAVPRDERVDVREQTRSHGR